MPTLRQRIDLRFLRHLTTTPEGRAHVLSQVAEAESSGEAGVFDQALAHVDDPEVARMIQRHQADEHRHAELFRACEARQGLAPREVPPQLKILDRIVAILGAPLQKPIETREDVMELYLLLQVIEERAIQQFDQFIVAFRDVDLQTAATFAAVKADEERHLKYCNAISRRYAPDEATRLATLERMRRAEAQAFRENQLANLSHTLNTGLVRGRARRFFWRALGTLASLLPSTSSAPAHALPAPVAA